VRQSGATLPVLRPRRRAPTEVETVDGELVDLSAAAQGQQAQDWAEKVAFMAQLKRYADRQSGKAEGWVRPQVPGQVRRVAQ
jgi:hypothetical protein